MRTVENDRRPLKVLLVPLGSEGDIAPFRSLADQLVVRGHSVRIAANPYFADIVQRSGHPLFPVGEAATMQTLLADPRLWSGFAGSKLLLESLLTLLPGATAPFLQDPTPPDLMVGSSYALAAAFAAEARRIPFVRLHLQPAMLRSVGDMPVLGEGAAWLRRLPAPMIRMLFGLMDRALDGRPLARINGIRSTIGLPPLQSFYRDACNSGAALGGLFPRWFAPAQPDWPTGFQQFDFPLPDSPPKELDPIVTGFLAQSSAPVLWTHGSANLHTDDFVRAAEAASIRLNLRAIIVVPGGCPAMPPPSPNILRVSYVPFDAILPPCRAIVHHGGIGTFAKAVRYGVPQLIIPRAFDQFDNAARAVRLGSGLAHSYRRLGSVDRTIRRLLSGAEFANRAREFASMPNQAVEIVPWLESVAATARL